MPESLVADTGLAWPHLGKALSGCAPDRSSMTNPTSLTAFGDPTLTVITWNILHTDLDQYPERIREAAAHLDGAHVIALQEARRDGTRDAAAEIAAQLGLAVAGRGVDQPADAANPSDVAVLTSLPVLSSRAVRYRPDSPAEFVLVELEAPSGRRLLVVSAHLTWGGIQEPTRVDQVRRIDQVVQARLTELARDGIEDAITVLGGDLNATPDADTIRFLTGLHAVAGQGAFWVDAWATSGDGSSGYTVEPSNAWAAWTARRHGVQNPMVMPSRRIDYLMVRGWCYSKPGYPVSTFMVGTRSVTGVLASDHWGVGMLMLDPLR
jgi:endonuclease/exonuclease/phosphatase family metal-dependent hydrolase